MTPHSASEVGALHSTGQPGQNKHCVTSNKKSHGSGLLCPPWLEGEDCPTTQQLPPWGPSTRRVAGRESLLKTVHQWKHTGYAGIYKKPFIAVTPTRGCQEAPFQRGARSGWQWMGWMQMPVSRATQPAGFALSKPNREIRCTRRSCPPSEVHVLDGKECFKEAPVPHCSTDSSLKRTLSLPLGMLGQQSQLKGTLVAT